MKLFFVTLILMISRCGYSQDTVVIKLLSKIDSGNHSFAYDQLIVDPLEKFEADHVKIPRDLVKYKVKVIRFRRDQFYCSAYKAGLLDLSQLKTRVYVGRIDTNNLCVPANLDNFYFLTGYDKSNKSLFIVDENHDLDFTNDTRRTEEEINTVLPGEPLKRSKPILTNIPICYNHNRYEINYFLYPYFDKTGEKNVDRIDNLSFECVCVKEGYSAALGGCIKFSVTGSFGEVFKKSISEIYFSSCTSNFPTVTGNDVYSTIGDTIKIGDRSYKLDSLDLSGKFITLIKLKNAGRVFGYNEGYYGRSFSENDFLTNKQLNSSTILNNNKYILLDFWGTWCTPCIEALPALVDIYKKYKNSNIEFISVAAETRLDTTLVKKDIEDYHLTWNHVVVNRTKLTARDLPKIYRIYSYPTTIVIAPNGKIVLRIRGKGQMPYLDQRLSEILTNNQ